MASDRPSWLQAIGYARLTITILLSLFVLAVLAAWADSYRVRWRPFPAEGTLARKFIDSGAYWEPAKVGRTWVWLSNESAFIGRTVGGAVTLTISRTALSPMRDPPFDHRGLGFSLRRDSAPRSIMHGPHGPVATSYWHTREVTLPFWALFLLAAFPAGLLGARACRRVRWLRTGRCLGCGYDLTGNTSGVCPECGTPAERASSEGAATEVVHAGSATPTEGDHSGTSLRASWTGYWRKASEAFRRPERWTQTPHWRNLEGAGREVSPNDVRILRPGWLS